MARRFIVGLIYCIIFYFGAMFAVGAGGRAGAQVGPGQDPAVAGREAGEAAVENSRPVIAFLVVGFVFLGSRLGFLPGTGADRSALRRV